MTPGFLVKQLLLGFILPALVALALVVMAWRPWRAAAGARYATTGGLALAVAYALGYWAASGLPEWPPQQATEWLVLLAGLAGVWGAVAGVSRLPQVLRVAGVVAVVGLGYWLQFEPLFRYTWSTAEAVLWLAGVTVLGVMAWVAMERLFVNEPATVGAFAACVLTGASAVVLALGGSIFLGQLTGVLAFALAVLALAARWVPQSSLAFGSGGALVVLWVGLWMNGAFYASVPAAAFIALWLMPQAAWLRRAGWLAERSGWQRGLMISGSGLALALVAAALTWASSPAF